MLADPHIAVVIPCYRAKAQILGVLSRIPNIVETVIVVDDCCPENSGALVESECRDSRVRVIKHDLNRGVGGAMVTGYQAALESNTNIIVKIDSDGQMDPEMIPEIVAPVLSGDADYVKANRFFSPRHFIGMPILRLVGNSILSFLTKAVSGYWQIMDPTNGYTAIHRTALAQLPLDKIDRGYFFETDMLFRLNTLRAVVVEVPLAANYGAEKSNLRIARVVFSFPPKYLNRLIKRIVYTYFVRDFGICSLELVFGSLLALFGGVFGAYHWILSVRTGVVASAGTVIVAALPFILGFQLLLSALLYDASNIPRSPLQSRYRK